MITIKVTDLENQKTYEDKLESLLDYHNPNPETITDFPPLEDTSLIDCLDLSFGVLLPINDGEDFFYQYINKPIFSDENSDSKSMFGKTHSSLFKSLPNINATERFCRRAWKENTRVDLLVEILEEDKLVYKFILYFIRNDDHLYAISNEINEVIQLQQEEDKLLNQSHEGLIIIDKQEKILLSNEKFFKIIGLTEEELLKQKGLKNLFKNFKIISNDISTSKDMEYNIKSIFNHEKSSATFEISPKNASEILYYQVNIIPIMYRSQEVLRISIDDITEHKLQEFKAIRLADILGTMVDIAGVCIGYYYYGEKKVQWFGDVDNIFDNENGELDTKNLETFYSLVIPEDQHLPLNSFKNLNKDNPDVEYTVRVKTAKGNIKYLHQFFRIFYDEMGEKNLLVCYTEDVTETKEKISQKEMLVKEVHHRVKNNLQIIISLLNLDLRFHPDDPMSVLSDTRARLNYMATLHEKIYGSSELSEVDIKEYLTDIISSLLIMYESEITFHEELESLMIDLDLAIPLGLIVTEIINNTIKYAFPDGNEGNFYSKFRVKNGEGILDCWDDGVGLPEDFNPLMSTSLGMTVIKSLTSQIDGEFKFIPHIGVHYQIRFPLTQK